MKCYYFLLMLLLLPITTYADFDENKSIEAMRAIQTDKSSIVVDLRSLVEYNEEHIPRAIHVNYSELQFWKPGYQGISEKTSIVLYCELGNLSSKAKAILTDAGFKNVIDAGSFGGLSFVSKYKM